MSAGLATPTTAGSHLEQERQRIGRLLDEVARLCETEIPPVGFFGEMLKRLLDALQAPAGAVWLRTGQGNIQLQYHINLKLVGLDKSEQAKQSHEALLMAAFSQPKPLHLPPNSGLGPPADGQVSPGNPSDFMLLLVPIVQDGQVAGVIEVWQNANRPANAIPGFMQYMNLMAELCVRYLRQRKMSELANQQQLWTQLEAFARQVHGSLNPVEVAYLVANEGRRLVECDRVSVAVRYGNTTSIEAVSGADVVEKRSNLIVLMRHLCDRVIDWGEKLIYKGEKDDSLPPKVLRALDDYLAESNARLLVVQPLRDEREGTDNKKKARSALVMECFEAPADPDQLLARKDVVGKHAAPALYNAIEHRRIPMRFLWMPLAKLQEGLGGKAKAIMALVTVAVTMLISALYLLPYPLKMDSTGQLQPSIRRVIYAPTKGIVHQFNVIPAEDVVEGRDLAVLADLDLQKQISNLRADIRKADLVVKGLEDQEKTAAAPAERLKARSQLEEKRQERDSKARELEALISRTSADPQREGIFFLKAPPMKPEEARVIEAAPHGNHKREWTVLNGNFREEWLNREARPSDPLLKLGAKDGPWEIELKIPQKHIGQIQKAFEAVYLKNPDAIPVLDVDFLLRSDPTRTFKGKLYKNKVAPEAVVNKEEAGSEPEPTVLAIVTIDDKDINPAYRLPPELLLSGAEVHAKVRCGNHRMGYSLFYGIWEFFYEKVVFFF